jgi:hypothetical protein
MPRSRADLTPYHIKKIENPDPAKRKAEAIARQRERKRIELMWNRDIRRVVDRYHAATPTTIAACLGVNPTPDTPHERTQLRQLYRRLERNAFHGRIRAHYEYTVEQHKDGLPKKHQRTYAGRIWYVSLNLQRREGVQYEHKAFLAHIRGTLERGEFELLRTDTELREAKPPVVYDLYGKLHQHRIAVEANLSDSPKDISAKCQLWQRYMQDERVEFPFPADRYLWVMETEQKARNVRARWIQDGLTSGRFWVTWADTFSPYRPASILEPIWLWPKDENFQAL